MAEERRTPPSASLNFWPWCVVKFRQGTPQTGRFSLSPSNLLHLGFICGVNPWVMGLPHTTGVTAWVTRGVNLRCGRLVCGGAAEGPVRRRDGAPAAG